MDMIPVPLEQTPALAAPMLPPEADIVPPPRQEREPAPGERELLADFREQVRVPAWLRDAYEQARRDRQYLHTDVLSPDDPDRVACNDLLRSLYAKMALIWPDSPEPVVEPPKLVDPEWPEEEIDAAGMPTIDPETGAPVAQLRQVWQDMERKRRRLARTAGLILEKFGKEARLGPVLQRAALDAMTAGLCWIKSGWREDPTKDPIGRRTTRPDGLDQAKKLKQLLEEQAAGRIDPDDARIHEIADLTEAVRRHAPKLATLTRDQRWLLLANDQPIDPATIPSNEPQRWQGGTADIVDLENLRIDWERVGCLEKLCDSRWVHERVWMTRDEIARKFNLTPDERLKLGENSRPSHRTGGDRPPRADGQTDPASVDLEAETRGENEVAVWETRHFENGKTYWWTFGLERFLRTEIPEVIAGDGFPYAPIFFLPVAGRFMPLSFVQLGRKLQDEINDTLTDDREARIARYPFYVTEKGAFDPEDKQAIRGRHAHEVVELSKGGLKAATSLQRVEGAPYEAALFQIGLANARQNLERQVGVPTEALQGTSSQDFAEGIKVAADNLSAQAQMDASRLRDAMIKVYGDWNDYALALFPTASARLIAGPWAYWPEVDRETMARGMAVNVIAAGNRGQRRQDLEDIAKAVEGMGMLFQARQQAAAVGKKLDIEPFLRRIMQALDLRVGIDALMQDITQAIASGAPDAGGLAPQAPGGQPPAEAPPAGAV